MHLLIYTVLLPRHQHFSAFICMDFIFVNWHAYKKLIQMKIFVLYHILYVRMPYYMKIKSKRKFKIRNIKLSKISLPMVFRFVTGIKIESKILMQFNPEDAPVWHHSDFLASFSQLWWFIMLCQIPGLLLVLILYMTHLVWHIGRPLTQYHA